MAEVVRMPKLSDTMTEGVVAEWHKKVGDPVESGDLLAEIETDKATMEFESFQEGVLLHIGIEKGATAPVDSILAILGEKGEDVQSLLDAEASAPAEEAAPAAEPAPAPAPTPAPAPAPVAAEPTPAPVAAPSVAAPAQVAASSNGVSGGRVKISPLAKKLAEDKGINIATVAGSGDNGRIVKRDIENYVAPAAGGGSVITSVGVEQYTDEPVSQMRKTIARRLAESKFTAPHFYLTVEIDMDNAIAARKAVNAIDGMKISFNDMVIKACAAALKRHPQVNSSWMEDKIRVNEHVNIGVAVAVAEGLLVPVVRYADTKTMTQIGGEVRELAGLAKDKKLQPAQWEGSTFTISNLGMFGIEEFTAIINSPDSCIMAVGSIKQTPVVKNGAVVPGNVMKVTLSCDHRVVDGAVGAAFLQTFKQMLENPVMMIA